jgi:spermidine/putrescine ABC transporter ATP-binding subunit
VRRPANRRAQNDWKDAMSDVSLQGVSKRYGDSLVVDGLDLEIRQGEFLTLLGPSGCGKTTTLRMIAGFVPPTTGRIRIGREDVTEFEPQKRQIGMVFQDYALFPHLTVAENVAFGLVERGTPREKIALRVRELLELIRLQDVAERIPAQLSGGQQQRVALARALAHPPRVLLMDEPLGALDLKMREHMQVELRRIQQQLGVTAVYVTHDQVEAMTMSDRIAVMSSGRIEQLDTPEAIYNAPSTRFVANFVGRVNFLDGSLVRRDERFAAIKTDCGVLLCELGRASVGETITIAVRPEHLTIMHPGSASDGMNVLAGHIASETFCGSVRQYVVGLAGGNTFLVETNPRGTRWKPGDEVSVGWWPHDGVVVAGSRSAHDKEVH